MKIYYIKRRLQLPRRVGIERRDYCVIVHIYQAANSFFCFVQSHETTKTVHNAWKMVSFIINGA